MINLSRALGLAEARKLELEHVTVHSSERVVLFYQRRASRAGTPACKGDQSEQARGRHPHLAPLCVKG